MRSNGCIWKYQQPLTCSALSDPSPHASRKDEDTERNSSCKNLLEGSLLESWYCAVRGEHFSPSYFQYFKKKTSPTN